MANNTASSISPPHDSSSRGVHESCPRPSLVESKSSYSVKSTTSFDAPTPVAQSCQRIRNVTEEITLPRCESHSTEVSGNEGKEGIVGNADKDDISPSKQDRNDIFRPTSIRNDSSTPEVVTNISGATSLETIDDETHPPTPLSSMDFFLENNGVKHATQLGTKAVVPDEANAKVTGNHRTEAEETDPVARKIALYCDPIIHDNRWTRVGASSAASAVSDGVQYQKPVPQTEIVTILETQNSDASPIPVHYMEGSATGWDFDDLAAEKVRRENAQDRIRGNVESTLPPLETRRTDNTTSPNDLIDKKLKEKEKSQVELASSLPQLENHSPDIAPVPVHFLDVADGNEGLFYQMRLQEKMSNFETNLSQSTSIKAKEKEPLDENSAKDDAGVEEGRDSYASLNISHDNFYSIMSPDVDIQDSLEFSVDSNTVFDQSMKHHRETNVNGDDPDISNLAVAKQVYESDEELPLYEAVEYDPSAKPPNHCNRKYFSLAAVGVISIGLVVAVSVVFGTKEAAPQSELQYGRPTLSPTTSPTSSRALSGIIEEIEANVLRRNTTFQNMTADDPRMLALEWILYDDERQLDVFDSNLHQRYILALLAFSLDSNAWKRCGGVDELESCTTSLSNEVKTVGYAPWLSEANECDWYGVTCVVGVVRGLDLANNSVIGEIVPEIAGLRSNLVFLDLSANCLYGTLPPEMGDLSSLELLKLNSNSFSGAFPEDLYKLSKLEQMDLAHQYFNNENCTRSDGTVVYLMHQKGDTENRLNNGIEGAILDDRIGGLKNLERLILENNYFYGRISSEIGKLKRLVYFNAAVNMLTGSLPDSFTELRNLKELWVEENSLTGEIPIEVGRMESLETFSVWLNPNMTGTIPYSLYNLTNLQNLLLAFNGFSGTLSTNIGNLKRLNRLQLNDNNFSGTVPSELGLCRDLEFIRLEFNEFRGSVPEQVCSLRDVALVSDDPYIEFFNADCLSDVVTSLPRLKCDCCYSCCDGTTRQCQIVD